MGTTNFNDAKNALMKKAFEWAVAEQARMGCMAEPISLTFESDTLTSDKKNCILSVFYDQATKKALFRRDWLDDMGIKYSILMNLDEIRQIAPMSARHLLNNGIKLYLYYDGPSGGVTRKMQKKWV